MAKTSLSGPENLHNLISVLWRILCFQRITFLRISYTPTKRSDAQPLARSLGIVSRYGPM